MGSQVSTNIPVMGLELVILLSKTESNRGDDITIFMLLKDRISVTKCTAFLEESDLVTEISQILRVFLYANSITTIKNVL